MLESYNEQPKNLYTKSGIQIPKIRGLEIIPVQHIQPSYTTLIWETIWSLFLFVPITRREEGGQRKYLTHGSCWLCTGNIGFLTLGVSNF